MDSDPIKQLQGLLNDPGKVLEKISSIHSALDSIKTNFPDSGVIESTSTAADKVAPRVGVLSDDPVYSRLMQALRDMQTQIEGRIQPLAAEIVRHEVARLRDLSDEHQNALNACLSAIDQNIVNCMARMDEYQCRCADLTQLNHRLADLGAAPEPAPPQAQGAATERLMARLESLRLEGKI